VLFWQRHNPRASDAGQPAWSRCCLSAVRGCISLSTHVAYFLS
jgi:hypothetical protein